ncbi:MAG TPA: hypothetical protein VF691_07315, partial [Cytophagaceae bacterium]
TCPSTKDFWTCGQRFAFYSMVKGSAPQPASFYSPGEYENLTCAQLTSQPYASIQPTPPDAVQGDGRTKVEITKAEMNTGCKNSCESKRETFRQDLLEVIKNRCYDLESCKESNTDNVILKEDFEVILNNLVEKCKAECNIQSHSCLESSCRVFNTAKNTLGDNSSDVKLEYGVGGPTPYCELNRYNRAMKGVFKFDMVSKCTNSSNNPTSTDKDFNCPPGIENDKLFGGIPNYKSPSFFESKALSNTIDLKVSVAP